MPTPPDHSDDDAADASPAVAADTAPTLPGEITFDDVLDALEATDRPLISATRLAQVLDTSQAAASEALEALSDAGQFERVDVSNDPVVWYPTDWGALIDRERIVLFPQRRELVVDQPSQFTRAQLSQFAHLVDTTRSGGYLYEIRQEDIWQAPYEDFEALLSTVRNVLPERSTHLEEWLRDQWGRAHRFTLRTHEDGYVVLEAASESLMGNVARQKLDDGQLRASISDTESWVAEEAIAEIKRILYEAGYPVQDERDLDSGEPIDVELTLQLREYQQGWIDRFLETGSGVFVGPPGSGKTVAALGALEAIGGETLILVPSRELATQWRDQLRDHTTIDPADIGEYHGGQKAVRPVTIATYQTAGMDRHRQLFDQREWGLIVYDEVHHVPSAVFRRSTELQTKARLGLSATPIREDDKEEDIFTLIGPPIGTDWDALFEAGFVMEPEVEIRYVDWGNETARNEYVSAQGHERRQLAATNPAKLDETRRLLADHAGMKTLIFVDYLDQGERFAEALDVPFISGEMRHSRRERLLARFREGTDRTLIISRVGDEGIDLPDADMAIVASGLGGSRRQGAQRAGRTMRPAGHAKLYVLATRGTTDEEFARRQMQHLSGKGIRVRETAADGDPLDDR
ncbi:MAG: DEAD/DEAH box helicase [Halobacteriales archaeon]